MTTTDNSWVLITGASSGIGEEFARQYAEQGHSLVLLARRLDRLQALAGTLRRQFTVDVVVERVDLSNISEVVHLNRRLIMNSILALSCIALVLSAHAAQADAGRPQDPHEQARQLILGGTPHSAAIRTSTAIAAPVPTDPHELARQRIVASAVTDDSSRPTLTTASQPTIDPHEHARRSILGNAGESGPQSTSSSRS